MGIQTKTKTKSFRRGVVVEIQQRILSFAFQTSLLIFSYPFCVFTLLLHFLLNQAITLSFTQQFQTWSRNLYLCTYKLLWGNNIVTYARS
jgi:hypothetical protein